MEDEEFLINPKADIQALQSTMRAIKKYIHSGTSKVRGVNMTPEEKAEEYAENILHCKLCTRCKGRRELTRRCEQFHFLYGGYLAGLAEERKEKCFDQNKDGTIRPCEIMKENERLKKEISAILSCANCQENKGGYVCEKKYNDKCLAQKIEYIKELKEQIEKMKSDIEDLIKIQSLCIEDDYNAGLLNGLIITYNSIFEERFLCCKWNEHKNKWELADE